jgi:hypothetical protein
MLAAIERIRQSVSCHVAALPEAAACTALPER